MATRFLILVAMLGLTACGDIPPLPDIDFTDTDTTSSPDTPDVDDVDDAPDVEPDTDATSPDVPDTEPDTDAQPLPLSAPANVVASTDRSGDIELTWDAAPRATGYRIERCDVEVCADVDWDVLAEVQATRYLDTSPQPAAPPEAPTLAASDDLIDRVHLTWSAVTAPEAPRYRYRVVSLGSGEHGALSEPSAPAIGHRAERPVTGYEVQLDDGAWTPTGLATTWDDKDAPMATLTATTAHASRGTYAEFVRLTAAGAGSNPGATRSYRIRAVTAYGPGPASTNASGRRVAGTTFDYQWERSADASDADYTPLLGAITPNHDDTGAPADGSSRFYRVIVSADGAQPVTSAPSAGSRQGPADTPSGVAATSDLKDYVRLTWQPVSGALGYHVYRDGQKLTDGNGINATSYDDTTADPAGVWAAPSAFTASQNQTEHVALTWAAPTRPLGALHTYRVSAINAAAEGTQSTPAAGRRAAPALTSYELGATLSGGTTYRDVGSVTAFNDTTAPRANITGGTITTTQGEHRAHVALTTSGGTVGTPATVSYQVRGLLADGTKTPLSTAQNGRRATGPLTRRWQRSTDTTQDGWVDLACTSTTCHDSAAPALGNKRWYRLELNALGAEPRTIGPLEGWRLAFTSVAGGSTSTCAVDSDRRVWCWGKGHLGWTVAAAATNPGRIPSLSDIVEVSIGTDLSTGNGAHHTCARTANGSVYCWGGNASGQLGIGSTTTQSTPTLVSSLSGVTSIALGNDFSCAVLGTGEARCWGKGGRLGNNETSGNDKTEPQVVRTTSGLPLTGVASVATGSGASHRCTRQSDGAARCWGQNAYGQLGDGTTTTSYGVRSVSSLSNASALALGYTHSCALINGGEVRCWGRGHTGQLGHGGTTDSTSPVTVSGLANANQISSAQYSTCARRITGAIVCWGRNHAANPYGELGNGSTDGHSATPVTVSTLTAVTALGSGNEHHCAIQGGDVYCWGRNHFGQLGDGTTTNRSVPTAVIFP